MNITLEEESEVDGLRLQLVEIDLQIREVMREKKLATEGHNDILKSLTKQQGEVLSRLSNRDQMTLPRVVRS